MLSSTRQDLNVTLTRGGAPLRFEHALVDRYRELLAGRRLDWTVHLPFQRELGSGGQGIVYLSAVRGADSFTLPVAVKVFAPDRYESPEAYDEAMRRIAHASSFVAQIQQDNLVYVHNFVERDRIRMMIMEWVDGLDLCQLLGNDTLERVEQSVSAERRTYIHQVVATRGPQQARMKPGVAVAIIRECLQALAALHRHNVVHADIKPSNVMLKRTGNAKIIDIGSAIELNNPPAFRTCTPAYAAPEVLDGLDATKRSDLASLGYVLVEMLAGLSPFAGINRFEQLVAAKKSLPQRLHEILPRDITCNELLMTFCRGLIAPDPAARFPDADAATLEEDGAAAFLRQLVKGDMSSEYQNELRILVEEIRGLTDREAAKAETEL